jgi:hypothetical protein
MKLLPPVANPTLQNSYQGEIPAGDLFGSRNCAPERLHCLHPVALTSIIYDPEAELLYINIFH